jgi:hypothetical protein
LKPAGNGLIVPPGEYSRTEKTDGSVRDLRWQRWVNAQNEAASFGNEKSALEFCAKMGLQDVELLKVYPAEKARTRRKSAA